MARKRAPSRVPVRTARACGRRVSQEPRRCAVRPWVRTTRETVMVSPYRDPRWRGRRPPGRGPAGRRRAGSGRRGRPSRTRCRRGGRRRAGVVVPPAVLEVGDGQGGEPGHPPAARRRAERCREDAQRPHRRHVLRRSAAAQRDRAAGAGRTTAAIRYGAVVGVADGGDVEAVADHHVPGVRELRGDQVALGGRGDRVQLAAEHQHRDVAGSEPAGGTGRPGRVGRRRDRPAGAPVERLPVGGGVLVDGERRVASAGSARVQRARRTAASRTGPGGAVMS